jgi:hypothetical protein
MTKRIIVITLLTAVLFTFFSVLSAPIKAYADCVAPPSGLVSWWGGDNNALDIIGTNNGAIHGGITYGQGEVGRAFNFDGASGSYLQIPPSAALNIQGALSISAWVYIRNVSGIRLLAGKAGSTQLYSADGILHFVVYSGGAPYHVVSTIALAGNSWHLVAGVFDGNAGVSRIYIDGVLNNTATSIPGQPDTNIAPYEIGGFSAFADNLDGLIDEVAIFNQALTGTDVQNIYNAGSAGMCRPSVSPPSGLISWWKGENNANDQFGINNGTLMNGATFAQGKVGQAFSFDGINDYVEITGGIGDFGASSFTVEFWMYSSIQGDNSFILGKNHANGGLGWDIRLNNQTIEVVGVNGWGFNITSDASVTPNNWHHIALSSTITDVALYVDGVLKGSSARSSISTTTNPFRIGYAATDYFYGGTIFSGRIDELGIFNRALSVSEIAAIYNAGSSGITPIDITPDAFIFIAQTGMPLNTTIVSNPITVTGINYPTSLSISGGEYQINGGSWTSSPGTVSNGNTVMVRQTSSASNSTLTTAALTIGGVNGAFNVTTAASDDPTADGLISWWRGENNAFDSIGNNNGILHGGTLFAPGMVGQTFSFDGADDYVEIPHSDSLNFGAHQPMSITLWVKRTSTASVSTIFAKRPDCGGQVHYILQWYGSGNWFVFGSTGAPGNGLTTTADKLPLNTWTFISITFDGTTATMYINGSPVASNAMYFDPNTAPLTLGAEPACPDYFGGLIDEMKIFNRALSAAEVVKLSGQVPNAFSFTAQTGMPLSTPVESNSITVTGISYSTSISITGGVYSVSTNGGSTWSPYSASTPSTVNLNNQVKVRQTSSGNYSTTTTATLTIGGVSGTFDVTTFASRTLTITKSGTGTGTVTSNPSGINCGSTCNAPFGQGTSVDILAAAAADSTFAGWSVDFIGNSSLGTLTMDSAKAVTATFNSKAEFTAAPLSGSVPHNVIFTDASTHSPTAWSWTFGDGGTSTQKNPVHTYRANNTYTVTLTATGTGGASTMTKTGYITVGPDPCSNPPYKIGGTTYSYPNIQAAYETMGSDTLQIQALEFSGGLLLDQNKTVTLQGGYGCEFTSNPGDTIVHSSMTITGGTVTVDNMLVQ